MATDSENPVNSYTMTQNNLFRRPWQIRAVMQNERGFRNHEPMGMYIEDYSHAGKWHDEDYIELNRVYHVNSKALDLIEYLVEVTKRLCPRLPSFAHSYLTALTVKGEDHCIVEIMPVGLRKDGPIEFKGNHYLLLGFACVVYTKPGIIDALKHTEKTDIFIDIATPVTRSGPALDQKHLIQPRGVFMLLEYLKKINRIYEIDRISEEFLGMGTL